MHRLSQSPRDPGFVQNPYPFYARMQDLGDMVWWEEMGMVCATSHAAVHGLLRDRRFGRAVPPEQATPCPPHLEAFDAVERLSLLSLDGADHKRLRGLVLRAFTSARLAALRPEIESLAHRLIDAFPKGPFDLLGAFCAPLPVRVIARLLGVPDSMAPQLLEWSHAMVAMYQVTRDRDVEDRANAAAAAFTAYLSDLIAKRRAAPGPDLLSDLIAAEEDGQRLSRSETIAIVILLLNAGHEATVHGLGNGVRWLLTSGQTATPDTAEALTEDILIQDPPLHLFKRYAYETCEAFGHEFKRGEEVALLLASAGHDPKRGDKPHLAFGGGVHFCLGAPLARMEMVVGLSALFERCPRLALAGETEFTDTYHFHGLKALPVTV